jgi:hypothetical protein
MSKDRFQSYEKVFYFAQGWIVFIQENLLLKVRIHNQAGLFFHCRLRSTQKSI